MNLPYFPSLLLLLGSWISTASAEVPEPPRQMRAAWMATVFNIDWPTSSALSAAAQKTELQGQLDAAAKAGLNTIILQVRPACDCLYASTLEPWSAFVSGKSGASPGYDPLSFAITEAHARGLELHAWVNPFRAKSGSKPLAENHVTLKHPEWVMTYGPDVWLDPGLPEVRQHTMNVVTDIVTRYDLDGIHIDDYFYPYSRRNPDKSIIPFPDAATFAKHGQGKELLDWRRANIDGFVEKFYTTVKALKKHVRVGISPFGIWQPGVPTGIQAKIDAYGQLGADSRKWLQKGWCDYFTPQLYWRIDPQEQSFSALLDWWGQQNTSNRLLAPGVATERIKSSSDPERPASEIIRQLELTAKYAGHSHWNLKALRENKDGITDLLKSGPYRNGKTLPPPCPWLDKTLPEKPKATATATKVGTDLSISAPKARWWTLQTQDEKGNWQLTATLPGAQKSYSLTTSVKSIAIRSVSPSGMLSEAVTVEVKQK